MKNRSLKAGGRLNRWSFKAGFTVSVCSNFAGRLTGSGSQHWPANRDANIDTSVHTPNDRP